MKERPILFSTPMVQAILSGHKTQTRRIVKKAPTTEINHRLIAFDNGWNWQVDQQGIVPTMHRDIDNPMVCPFGQIGDQLWVRETFASGLCTKSGYAYRATHKAEDLEEGWFETIKWTPSIHMPRTACRLILEITNIRVERLKGISDSDAKAEGVLDTMYGWKSQSDSYRYGETPSDAFQILWEEINGSDSLKANPWVWVVEFKVIQGGAV